MKVGVGLVVLAACAAPAHPPLAAPRVVMRDAGAEPRYLLRYQFKAGQTEHCEVDLKLTAKIAINGGLQTPEAPTIRASVDATVHDVATDGSAHLSTQVVAARLLDDGNPEPRARAHLAKLAEQLVGTRTTRRVSPRGELSELSAAAAGTLKAPAPDLRWALDRALIVLPTEPVGNGARWDAEYQAAFIGANMSISEHVHVVEAHAGEAQIETDSTMTAPVQLLDRDVVLRKVSGEGHALASWSIAGLCAAGEVGMALNYVVDLRSQRVGFRFEVRNVTRRLP